MRALGFNNMNSKIKVRTWERLKYLNPKDILIELREIDKTHPLNEMPYDVSTLRSPALKQHGQSRQCALFCYGMSQAFNITMNYADSEDSDYDFISYTEEHNLFIPIQMKEFVPEKVNSKTELEIEIAKLGKYVDSSDLCVAMYINRVSSIDFSKLKVPDLNIGELWFFGAGDPSQSTWKLIGNVLEQAEIYTFEYPKA